MTRPPERYPTAASWLRGLPALALLLPLLAWPLAAVAWRALAPHGALSGAAISAVLGDRFTWERLGMSAAQAAATMALALLLGLPVAYVLSQIRFPGRRVLRALATLPLVLPTIVVAVAYRQWLGPQGWLNDALEALGLGPVRAVGTPWAILAAQTCYAVAIVTWIVGGAWAQLDPRAQEAARLLGAGGRRVARHVTLPALRRAVAAAAALTFLFAFTSFAIVLILGAPRYDTLEVTIYRTWARSAALPEVAALSLVQLAVTLAVLVGAVALRRRATSTRPRPDRGRARRARPLARSTWPQRALLVLVALVLVVLIAVPLAALLHGALTRDGALTGAHFAALFGGDDGDLRRSPLAAARWSLAFAAGATAIALVAGGGAAIAIARARGRLAALLQAALLLPLAVPAIVLAMGDLLAFDRGRTDLRGSPLLVLLAHALLAYPFVLGAMLPAARALDPHLPEAARMLGAPRRRAWRRVTLPVLRRALLVGAVFAAVLSLGELGATLVLSRRDFATLPLAIYEALGRPGTDDLGRALALSTVLAGCGVVASAVIERFRDGDVSNC